ncbi:MAG: hypothetical protein QXD48_00805 [Candidatus Aenigmatarchaeota archaeon]
MEKINADELYMPQTEIWKWNLKKYAKENSLKEIKNTSFYLTKFEDFPTADNISVLLVRIALADLEGRLSKEKKYVVLQTYYDDGDLSTLDIVRLPLDLHKEIKREYLNKILTENISRQPNLLLSKDTFSRYLTAGGFIDGNEKNIEFYGSSSDFSNKFSIYSVNDIVAYLVKESGLFENVKSKDEGLEKGEEYINRCLDLMKKYKLKSEFYSQLIDLYQLEKIRNKEYVGSHILYSIAMMKSIDKAIKEDKDFLQAFIEEGTEGICREMLIRGIAEILKTSD